VNFGKDYVYFGQKLVAEPTSHEPHFLLLKGLWAACVLVNFGKDYVYFGPKLVAEPTSHEPQFLLLKGL
jgi:hypothetical protein